MAVHGCPQLSTAVHAAGRAANARGHCLPWRLFVSARSPWCGQVGNSDTGYDTGGPGH